MGTARKIGNLQKNFVRSPLKTIKSIPDLAESVRMRMSKDSTFRLKRHVILASHCPVAMLDRVVQLWNPRSVLDVGCGAGKVVDYFVERLPGVSEVRPCLHGRGGRAHPPRCR